MSLKTALRAAGSLSGCLMIWVCCLPSLAFSQAATHAVQTPADLVNIYIHSPDWDIYLDYYRTGLVFDTGVVAGTNMG